MLAAGMVLAVPDARAGAASREVVEAFTGGHTRVVWVVDEGNIDSSAMGDRLTLMGYDSRDGLGVRVILPGPENFNTPLLTPDGKRIVFSNRITNQISVVNWDGTGRRVIKAGGASDLWEDEDGRVWVYGQPQNGNPHSPVIRFYLENPEVEEDVWNATPVQTLSAGAFQVSRDGRRAAGTFPWPNSGIAELPNIAWRKIRDGCWPSMAPDNSYMSWTFDGRHRNILMSRPGVEKVWRIPLSNAPGVNDYEVYHPRWSNHVRYMAMTGPYSMGDKKIKVGSGAEGVEIHLGRFRNDFTGIEEWLQLTNSPQGEFFPDVWIEGGERVDSRFEQAGVPPAKGGLLAGIADWFKPKPEFQDDWPVSTKGLVFLWESNESANEFESVAGGKRSARLQSIGGARWGPHGEMHIVAGGYTLEESFAKEIRDACQETNQLSIEAIITTARSPQHGPARIISLSQSTRKRNFTLGQSGDRLMLRLQTSSTNRNGIDFDLAPLTPDKPHHVIVSYQPGLLVCYVDGKRVRETSLESGTFEDWKTYKLLFGKEYGGQRQWEGFLDGVAIYNRFVGGKEAAKKFEAASSRLAERETMPVVKARAEMLSREDPPRPESIAPYRRALAVNSYLVKDSTDPGLVGRRIQVAEWVLLDGGVPAGYESTKPGTLVPLELQPYDSHPQLESERQIGGMTSLDDPLYYHISSGK